MPRYEVLIGWTMSATVQIEAESPDAAWERAMALEQIPHDDAEYVEGTLEVAEIKDEAGDVVHLSDDAADLAPVRPEEKVWP